MSAAVEVTKQTLENALRQRHGEEIFSALKASRAAVAGLGGLGSNIALMLARAGVGSLLLVDFDEVDITNINRQQYFLEQIGMKKTDAAAELIKRVNPYINIETKCARVSEENAGEIFKNYETVCEAFDRPENKAMLVNALLEEGKTVVSGSGMAGYLSANSVRTRKISDKFYICGDEITASSAGNGLMAPRVGVCAAHQANMVIRLLLGEREP